MAFRNIHRIRMCPFLSLMPHYLDHRFNGRGEQQECLHRPVVGTRRRNDSILTDSMISFVAPGQYLCSAAMIRLSRSTEGREGPPGASPSSGHRAQRLEGLEWGNLAHRPHLELRAS